ncbi:MULTISPECIES: MarR family transcriptional regulator [unclassified Streptomyces]|uniref:MarR family winged helix-turn-helix transcriptional regulator n=1 Tax=unclassified Streptomyces TaxID=2593676 RepID=UPI000DC7E1B1|nr:MULTISPECIES: MarR family transcriptional regulator [unclassified Streptomyces]AWZ04870.1 transcriptional regulator [Streptomyces sp. ICC4]AWZ12019.1 transcriptional regulator [Streptomyces sp. ICC1]
MTDQQSDEGGDGGTELVFLLGLGFQLLLGEFTRRLGEAGHADGLRPLHGMVFQALGGRGATATELAERLGVTKQAAGQIVDDLERRGYVRREPHPGGGRRKLVVLTDAANAHLHAAGRVLHELEAELGRDSVDLAALRAELGRLVGALNGDGPLPALRPVW